MNNVIHKREGIYSTYVVSLENCETVSQSITPRSSRDSDITDSPPTINISQHEVTDMVAEPSSFDSVC